MVFAVSSIKSCLIIISLIRLYYAKKLPNWLATNIDMFLNLTNILFRHLNGLLSSQSVTKVNISFLTSLTPHRDKEREPVTKIYSLVDCYMVGLLYAFIGRMSNAPDRALIALIDFDRTPYTVLC